jgi:protein TonB
MTTQGEARVETRDLPDIIFKVPVVPAPKVEATVAPTQHQATPSAPLPTIAVPTITPTTLPPIDVNTPVVPAEEIRIGGPGALTSPYPSGPRGIYVPGSVLNSDAVERVPSLIGNARAPRYPDALRQSNIAGNVAVRFVVDTLGRAEMDGVEILETSHPLFAESVKNALAFYRFTPGEVAGHKVRTMVQIPFTFSLTK